MDHPSESTFRDVPGDTGDELMGCEQLKIFLVLAMTQIFWKIKTITQRSAARSIAFSGLIGYRF